MTLFHFSKQNVLSEEALFFLNSLLIEHNKQNTIKITSALFVHHFCLGPAHSIICPSSAASTLPIKTNVFNLVH